MTNGVTPASINRATISAQAYSIDPTSAEQENDMADLVVTNWAALDAYIDVQNVEKALAVGTIPHFALEGAGALTLRASGSYDDNGATGTVTPKIYTSANYIAAGGVGTLAWTSAGLSAVHGGGANTGGFIDWEFELRPLKQTDGTWKQLYRSTLTILPSSSSTRVQLVEWGLLALDLSLDVDIWGSLVNSSATPLARICACVGKISPPRSGA